IKALCPVDVRNRQGHDLELEVDGRGPGPLRRGVAARVCTGHIRPPWVAVGRESRRMLRLLPMESLARDPGPSRFENPERQTVRHVTATSPATYATGRGFAFALSF